MIALIQQMLLKHFLIKNTPNFLFLGEPELEQVKYNYLFLQICQQVFFVVNSLIVKPERVSPINVNFNLSNLKVTYIITTSSQSALGIWMLQEPEMAFPQLATKFAINFSVKTEIFENIVFGHVTNILICLLTFLNKIFLASKFFANCLRLTSLCHFSYM